MKDYDPNKESPYLKYCFANNIYGWAMLKRLPVNNFQWRNDKFSFNEDLI